MSSAEIKAKHAKLKKPPASARRGGTRQSASKLVQAKDPLFPRKQIRQIAHKMRVVGAAARLQGMIYAGTKQEIETKRKAFIRKWRLKCEAVADSLEEAGNKLFTFPRFPESQWKSIRTSNGIERLHEEWIKTQTVLPSAETAAMLFWALLASGQITMTAPVAKTINTLLGAPSLILPGEETKQ
jgi:hypothetical protein